MQGNVPAGEVRALVTACSAALSSTTVANDFLNTLDRVCYGNSVNRVTCGSIRETIPTVLCAICAHGRVYTNVAVKGCSVLGRLCLEEQAYVERIVLSDGGLKVICSVMEWYAGVEEVQSMACTVLYYCTLWSVPAIMAAMRDVRVIALLIAAKDNHPRDGDNTVKYWADAVLDALAVTQSSREEAPWEQFKALGFD